MVPRRGVKRGLSDSVPGLGTAVPLVPGLWSRPFMEPIPFSEGEAALAPAASALLDEMAVALAWFATACRIEVAGHAWEEGSPEAARRLSMQRAEAVRAALVERGLPPGVIRTRAYGTDRPDPNAEGLGAAAQCRRVELWLHQHLGERELPCPDPGGEACCRAC